MGSGPEGSASGRPLARFGHGTQRQEERHRSAVQGALTDASRGSKPYRV